MKNTPSIARPNVGQASAGARNTMAMASPIARSVADIGMRRWLLEVPRRTIGECLGSVESTLHSQGCRTGLDGQPSGRGRGRRERRNVAFTFDSLGRYAEGAAWQ